MNRIQIKIKIIILDFFVNFTISMTFDTCDLWHLQQFYGWDNWDLNQFIGMKFDRCDICHMTLKTLPLKNFFKIMVFFLFGIQI